MPPHSPPMTPDDVTSIARRFEDDYAEAFNRRDASGLAALFMDDATVVTEWGDVVLGREAFVRGLATAFERLSGELTLENTPTYAALVADDVIVSHGTSRRRNRSTGEDDVVAFTRVLVRRGDAWRLAANHVSEPSTRVDPRASHT